MVSGCNSGAGFGWALAVGTGWDPVVEPGWAPAVAPGWNPAVGPGWAPVEVSGCAPGVGPGWHTVHGLGVHLLRSGVLAPISLASSSFRWYRVLIAKQDIVA